MIISELGDLLKSRQEPEHHHHHHHENEKEEETKHTHAVQPVEHSHSHAQKIPEASLDFILDQAMQMQSKLQNLK